MARGRKRTPSKILKFKKTYRPDQRGNEPEPAKGRVSCPDWLSREAKAEWKRIAPELKKTGVLAMIDRAMLAAYCQTWGDYYAATKAVAKDGTTFTTPQGYIAKNPMVTVLNEARSALLRYASEFGLTPSSRAKLDVDVASEDALDKILKTRNG